MARRAVPETRLGALLARNGRRAPPAPRAADLSSASPLHRSRSFTLPDALRGAPWNPPISRPSRGRASFFERQISHSFPVLTVAWFSSSRRRRQLSSTFHLLSSSEGSGGIVLACNAIEARQLSDSRATGRNKVIGPFSLRTSPRADGAERRATSCADSPSPSDVSRSRYRRAPVSVGSPIAAVSRGTVVLPRNASAGSSRCQLHRSSCPLRFLVSTSSLQRRDA